MADGLSKAKLFMWEGFALWVGHTAPSLLHQHHALQLNISFTEAIQHRLREEVPFLPAPTLLINANVPHQIRIPHSHEGIFFYIEPESQLGRALRQKYFPSGQQSQAFPPIQLPTRYTLLSQLDGFPAAKALSSQFIHHMLPDFIPPPPNLDARIQQLQDYIQAHITGPLPLPLLAAETHLSESHLMHLFSAQVGIPIRRYILWRRLIEALFMMGEGESMTYAAHAAGFADSAHLSRTVRGMVGHPASTIFSRFVQVFLARP